MVLTLLFVWLTYFTTVCTGFIDTHKFANIAKRLALSEYKMENANEDEKEAAQELYDRELDEYKGAFVGFDISQLRVKLVMIVNMIVILTVVWWPSKKQNNSEMATPRKPSD